MTTNEAARLVSVPTHTVPLPDLLNAEERLFNSGMKSLADILRRRIKVDPRFRAQRQQSLSEET